MFAKRSLCYVAVIFLSGVIAQGCWDGTTIAIQHSEETAPGRTDGDTGTGSGVDTQLSSDTPVSTDTPSDTETELATESDTGTGTGTGTGTDSDTGCGVPASFSWNSSDILIPPPSGARAIKDPTVVYYNGAWLIYATSYTNGLGMTYLSVTDWNQADTAEQTAASTNENLTGYKAAPQLFYFSQENRSRWYLVYQTPEPAYSTSDDPTDVASWSAATQLMTTTNVLDDAETTGIDYWVICDDTDCYIFFSADNGVLYRARTSIADFPNGFDGSIEPIMEDTANRFNLWDACNVYKMAGTDQYLLLVSAVNGSRRFYRSWTADTLDGNWTRLADTEDNAFASINNVTGGDWALSSIEHGEMLRWNPDETMTIDTCDMRYLYSGVVRVAASETEFSDYSLGLLTDAR